MSAQKKAATPNPLADIDIRILERKLRKGEITREEYEKLLDSLPDTDDFAELDEKKLTPGTVRKTAAD